MKEYKAKGLWVMIPAGTKVHTGPLWKKDDWGDEEYSFTLKEDVIVSLDQGEPVLLEYSFPLRDGEEE
jgi:hypothetical protein